MTSVVEDEIAQAGPVAAPEAPQKGAEGGQGTRPRKKAARNRPAAPGPRTRSWLEQRRTGDPGIDGLLCRVAQLRWRAGDFPPGSEPRRGLEGEARRLERVARSLAKAAGLQLGRVKAKALPTV